MYVKGPLLFISAVAALTTIASPTFAQSKPSSVTVINTAANPVPVTGTVVTVPEVRPSDTAVQFALEIASPRFCGERPSYYEVPAGNRLVIEFMSARATISAVPSQLDLSLITTVGASSLLHFLPMQIQVYDGLSYHTGAMSMRAYADAGTKVCAFAFLQGLPLVQDFVTVSGYLEPQP